LLKTSLDVTHIKDNLYHIAVKNNYDVFLKELQNFKVIKINSLKQSIEDIFMKYYGDGQYE